MPIRRLTLLVGLTLTKFSPLLKDAPHLGSHSVPKSNSASLSRQCVQLGGLAAVHCEASKLCDGKFGISKVFFMLIHFFAPRCV